MPTKYNANYMLDKRNEFYTVTIPYTEMPKFKDREELEEFLFEQYMEIFFTYKGMETEREYSFYMQKKAENKLIKDNE